MESPPNSAAEQQHVSAGVSGDFGEHEQRHRRRSSGAESTLAPLPVFPPAKVLPRGASFSAFSDCVVALPGAENVIQDASDPQVNLQMQTANYEIILRHFNLRKLHPEQSVGKAPPSAVDYSLHHGSCGSARHLGSSRQHLHRTPRFSLYRSLKNLRRNAFGAVVTWLCGLRRPMTPMGVATKLREATLFWVYCFQLLYLPFAPVYLVQAPTQELAMVRINIALELIYLADMLATSNTAVASQQGILQLVTSRSEIAKRYFKGGLLLDFLSALPLETGAQWLLSTSHFTSTISQQLHQPRALLLTHPVLYHVGNALRVLRWRNFARAAQSEWITQLATRCELQCRLVCGIYCELVRALFKMLALALVVAHYSACFWHGVICVLISRDDALPASLAAMYLGDARHVLLLMAGSGEETGDQAKDAFAIVLMLAGVLFFSCLLGHVLMLITTANYSSRVEFERKKQVLVSKMAKLQLPPALQTRIYRYYEHLWTEYDATHEEDITGFTKELARPLALEVGLCRYMNLVMRVPFWTDCSPDFVSAVVLNLRVLVFLPDDFIVRKGEIGTEFFMIHRGVGELADIQRHESVRLTTGASFGEVALLMNCKRATSVQALSYMEICSLPRSSFQEVLSRHHNDRRRMVLRILKRGLESNEHPQLWQEVLLRKARTHIDGGETSRRSYLQAARELNSQRALAEEASREINAAEGAEILADAMDLMVNETVANSPTSDGLLRWNTSDPRGHDGRRPDRSLVAHASSHYESVRSPTTSVAQDTSPDTVSIRDDQLESRGAQPAADSNENQPANEQLELLRSLMTQLARIEEKLSRVEAKVAQLEKHPLSHSGSIGKALIAVTVPSYATTSEDSDALAQHATVRPRDDHLVYEPSRRALSLDVDARHDLSRFQRRRLQSSSSAVQSTSLESAALTRSSVSGREDTTLSQSQRQSASFRLQPRRASKSTLADQLWRKNSSPSE